jgi:succinate dehydrogenase/fumarate reductase flavoprotein subunit
MARGLESETVSGRELDVVVIGSGGAGLIAALTAHDNGARVVVVEAESVVGGASRLSAGMLMGAGTEVQRAAGLNDDPEGLYQEYMLANQYLIKPGIVHRMAFESGPGIDWLAELGVRFFPDVMQGGGERVARSHVPEAVDQVGGQHIVDVLHQQARQRGIEIALGNRVDRLLERDGVVVGVGIGEDEYEAAAVVLATGGFGANKELIAKHLPSMTKYLDLLFYIGPDSSRGEGIGLASEVGGNFVGEDVFQPLLTPAIDTREFDAYLPGWVMLLGPAGRRFCDETAPYGQTYGLVKAAGDVVYGIFDAQTMADNGSPELPTFKPEFPPGSPMPAHIYSKDGLERLLASGGLLRADTLEELAERLGLPVDAVVGSVARYNDFAAAGHDRDYRKPARFLRGVHAPPFYGMPIRPSTMGFTSFGVEIDDEGRVMDPCARPIEGLFAAGECTGGVLGTRYLGSGNMWASCIVFGRLAGRAAAAHALQLAAR